MPVSENKGQRERTWENTLNSLCTFVWDSFSTVLPRQSIVTHISAVYLAFSVFQNIFEGHRQLVFRLPLSCGFCNYLPVMRLWGGRNYRRGGEVSHAQFQEKHIVASSCLLMLVVTIWLSCLPAFSIRKAVVVSFVTCRQFLKEIL